MEDVVGLREPREGVVGSSGLRRTEMGLSGERFEGVVVGRRMRFGDGMQMGQVG
jgi:hypothetical protein